MSVFSASINHRSFYTQISAVCFMLGLLLAATFFTVRRIATTGEGASRTGFIYYDGGVRATVEQDKQYQSEIKKLRERNTELEKIAANGTDAAKALNKELQETEVFAGLTEAMGPGVQVTLTDSKRQMIVPSNQTQLNSLIHDSDIANVINELRASGAEAISVNGQRVVGSTSIRCVGPVVHVNNIPAAPPYIIQAIGDPKVLDGGLNLPGGVLDGLRQFDPNMLRVDEKPKLLLPAFAGSTQMRFARAVDTSTQDSSKESK